MRFNSNYSKTLLAFVAASFLLLPVASYGQDTKVGIQTDTASSASADEVENEFQRQKRIRKAYLRRQIRENGGNVAEGDGAPGIRRMGMRQGMGMRKQFMNGGPLNLAPLNLTEVQKTKIQQLRNQTSIKARELRKKLVLTRQEMKDLMFDPNASDETIRSKRKDVRKLQDQSDEVMIDDFLAIRSVLTPEQRKRLPEIKPVGPRGSLAGRDAMPPPPHGGPHSPPGDFAPPGGN